MKALLAAGGVVLVAAAAPLMLNLGTTTAVADRPLPPVHTPKITLLPTMAPTPAPTARPQPAPTAAPTARPAPAAASAASPASTTAAATPPANTPALTTPTSQAGTYAPITPVRSGSSGPPGGWALDGILVLLVLAAVGGAALATRWRRPAGPDPFEFVR
jgi:hypothetical protein